MTSSSIASRSWTSPSPSGTRISLAPAERRQVRVDRERGPGELDLVALLAEREGGREQELAGAVGDGDPSRIGLVVIGDRAPERTSVRIRVPVSAGGRPGDRLDHRGVRRERRLVRGELDRIRGLGARLGVVERGPGLVVRDPLELLGEGDGHVQGIVAEPLRASCRPEPDRHRLRARVHLLVPVGSPPVALIEGDRGRVLLERPEEDLVVGKLREAIHRSAHQGSSGTLPPAIGRHVDGDELRDVRPELRLPGGSGDEAVPGELAVDLGHVAERVLDRAAQPDVHFVAPAGDRQVGESLLSDDVAVGGAPSRHRDGDDRIGVVRCRLADPDRPALHYCAAFRSERSSWASPRYAWAGL